MDDQGRAIQINVIINREPIRYDEIDFETRNRLNDIGIDVYNRLKDFECFIHSSRKLINVNSDDNDIMITIYTCCEDFAKRIKELFSDYAYKVIPVFMRNI